VGTVLLPLITFQVSSFIIRRLSGQTQAVRRLEQLPKKDRKPLNQRTWGYDPDVVKRLWGALARDPDLLSCEERCLRLDLISPLLYGSAFAISLLLAWGYRDRSFGSGWLLLPVVILILADWTENFAQLKQLRLYRQGGPEALQSGGIQVASRATTVKILFFIGCWVLIVWLCWK
jgi:hypothetical protein